MRVDFWYGNTLEDVKRIDAFFSDVDIVYRGNMYDANGKIIGDYSTKDSCEIAKYFINSHRKYIEQHKDKRE